MLRRNDMGVLMQAVATLKALPWFAECLTDLRGFRVEDRSDLTPFVKGAA